MFCRFINRNINNNFRFIHSNLNVINILNNKIEGKEVNIKGWIKAMRNMKDKIFIDLNDGSTPKKLQIVIPKSMKSENLNTGASIEVAGLIALNKNGDVEINAKDISVIGKCKTTDGYPFVPRQTYSSDYIRQYLHFRPRTSEFSSLLRIRSKTTKYINDYFTNDGYISINTPILTSNDCEGAGEIFSVIFNNKELLKTMKKEGVPNDEAYFNSKTFLTVSGQLHLEAAVHGLNKVYTLGPTFRAENSKSRLHLSEFYMLEIEKAFLYNLEDLIKDVEVFIKHITKRILDECIEDIAVFRNDNLDWLDKPFIVLTYDEAIDILVGKYKGNVQRGLPLRKEHEHFLVEYNDNTPTFVVNWPVDIKPFYMKQLNSDLSKVAAFDLLVSNVGELIGGSLREDDFTLLSKKIPNESGRLNWYLDIRRFGGVPTGGYGMGFERYLQFLLNIQNIKDTIPFPRWPHNCFM